MNCPPQIPHEANRIKKEHTKFGYIGIGACANRTKKIPLTLTLPEVGGISMRVGEATAFSWEFDFG